MAEKKAWMTGKEVAAEFKATPKTWRARAKAGLVVANMGKVFIYERASVEAYMWGKKAGKGGKNGEDAALAELDKDTDRRSTRAKNVESQVREYKAKRDLTLAEIGLHSAEEFRVAQDTVEPREQEIEKNRQEAIAMHEKAVAESERLRGISGGLEKAGEQLGEYRNWCVADFESLIAFYEALNEKGAFDRLASENRIKLPELQLDDNLYAGRVDLRRIWTDIPSVEKAQEDQEPEE